MSSKYMVGQWYSPWDVFNNAEEAKHQWNEIKTMVKTNTHKKITEQFLKSDKGKVLKLYKKEWYTDNVFYLNNVSQIKTIRQMRNGTSYLAGHSPFVYVNPDKCPCCGKNLKENNHHYLMVCQRFSNQRKNLLNRIKPLLKRSKLRLKVKLLLGFPDRPKDVKRNNFNTLREILWYEVSYYISHTGRFTKPSWILPFIKKEDNTS